jgi:sec-independent protein translocase protein TatA
MELGSGEILLLMILALLIYGGRLPEVARALGRSVAELKRGLTETKQAVASQLDPELRVDLDEPAREVRRAAAHPEALATENVSAATPPSAETGEPGNSAGTDPKPP